MGKGKRERVAIRSLKRQTAVLSVLMALVIAALTLGGLQLFGKGKAKPSAWPNSMYIAAQSACTAALLSSNDGISPQASETKTIGLSLRCGGITVGTLSLMGTENTSTMGGGGITVTVYNFNLTCDISSYMEQNYTNFRIMPESIITSSSSQNGIMWNFYSKDNMFGLRSGASNATSVSQIQSELSAKNAYVACDLIRVEVPLPATPTKEGHTFAGWYYGTQAEHSASCTAYDGEPIYEDTNLHAHWAINTFTVTFNASGGSEVESKTVNWNTAVPLTTPTRIGYNFLGWYLPDGTPYTNQPIKANTTLTAKWQIKTFKVTFYVGEEKHAELTVEYGTVLSDAMEEANIQSYMAMNTDGIRLSKQSVITENTSVLVTELTGWEKYGDFVARNQWYTWVIVALGGVLLILSVVGIVTLVKGR